MEDKPLFEGVRRTVWKRLKTGKCSDCLAVAEYTQFTNDCWWCKDCVDKRGFDISTPETVEGNKAWQEKIDSGKVEFINSYTFIYHS